MLTAAIHKLLKRENLTYGEASHALNVVISAENCEQIAAFLALLRAKGETVEELSAFVHGLQQQQINVIVQKPVMDIVGTGGDGAHTANISTMASILAASCGVPVLKHGNRAVSSLAGSADVLEALGLKLDKSPEQIAHSLETCHLGFCFAPVFNPVLAKLKPIRQHLKIATLFNLLGPLLNPGRAQYYLLGVYDPSLQQRMASLLMQLDVKRAMVVCGHGLDELSCIGPCDVIEIKDQTQQHYRIDPTDYHLPNCRLDDLIGKDAAYNAQLIHQLVDNQPSHLANTAILNAGVAVYLYGKTQTISEGIDLVRKAIEAGQAKKTLREFIYA